MTDGLTDPHSCPDSLFYAQTGQQGRVITTQVSLVSVRVAEAQWQDPPVTPADVWTAARAHASACV